MNPAPDSIMWHYDKLGTYSVRSGYHLGSVIASSPGTSVFNSLESWWNYFWQLKIPLKVKIFLWKACNNWIPSNLNSTYRRVSIANSCLVCYTWLKSTLHALWCCHSLKMTQWICPFMDKVKVNVDAALATSHGVVGIGIIVRDSQGQVLGASA
ncbi:hypothetical protein Ddye_016958 [Dipteronia dyeriana]|uniref:Reverse transcriptase zinc-binding domain-containing protein n=1 Tax=Dipteronia dyeriana TaxID=168575 RepID=A0AAD9WZC5_9ROSI|nr:hypothetical protein Ddye_016958 [Dipteronia dyeriana]